MGIRVISHPNLRAIPQKRRIVQWLKGLIQKEGWTLQSFFITCISDDALLELNRTHLNHNYFTDILTFDYSDFDRKVLNAELYISLDRVLDNCNQFKVSFFKEFLRVVCHGLFHCFGFGDSTPEDIQLMREQEEKALKLYEEMFHVEL